MVLGLRRSGIWRALAVGQLAYVAYVVWIGGDFMSGRFLTAPFVVGIAQLIAAQIRIRMLHLGIALMMVAVQMSIRGRGPMSPGLPEPYREFHGITDERAHYYPRTGLMRTSRPFTKPELADAELASQMRAAGQTVATREMVGMFGHAAGPGMYVVDRFGLGDPLLARLPVTGAWRIGHFPRELPDGYIQTLRVGTNQISDPGLREFYESLSLITRAPIWSGPRWRAIARMNLGLTGDLLPAPPQRFP
jgi:arabinofuranosyltransferase